MTLTRARQATRRATLQASQPSNRPLRAKHHTKLLFRELGAKQQMRVSLRELEGKQEGRKEANADDWRERREAGSEQVARRLAVGGNNNFLFMSASPIEFAGLTEILHLASLLNGVA